MALHEITVTIPPPRSPKWRCTKSPWRTARNPPSQIAEVALHEITVAHAAAARTGDMPQMKNAHKRGSVNTMSPVGGQQGGGQQFLTSVQEEGAPAPKVSNMIQEVGKRPEVSGIQGKQHDPGGGGGEQGEGSSPPPPPWIMWEEESKGGVG